MTGDPFFHAVVRRQRACRSFSVDPVDDDTVGRVLEAATYAPSAENSQPWVFVVVRDPDARAAIGRLMQRAWESGARAVTEGRVPERMLDEVEAGATGGIAGAPVLVVAAVDTTATFEPALASSIWPAVQNLLLAATAEGLGSAITTLATAFDDADLRHLTGLPDHVRPVAVVPLGHPARPLSPPRRAPVAEKAHRERFGQPWA
jgi:nitroreductase